MTDGPDQTITVANAGLRALLELGAVVALGYWGYRTGGGLVGRVVLGVGLPLAVVFVWGLVGAPKAPLRAGQPWRRGVELAIPGGATVALFLVDRPVAAALFGLLAALNAIAIHRWGRPESTSAY